MALVNSLTVGNVLISQGWSSLTAIVIFKLSLYIKRDVYTFYLSTLCIYFL